MADNMQKLIQNLGRVNKNTKIVAQDDITQQALNLFPTIKKQIKSLKLQEMTGEGGHNRSRLMEAGFSIEVFDFPDWGDVEVIRTAKGAIRLDCAVEPSEEEGVV